jgi:hypothetical protein
MWIRSINDAYHQSYYDSANKTSNSKTNAISNFATNAIANVETNDISHDHPDVFDDKSTYRCSNVSRWLCIHHENSPSLLCYHRNHAI